MFYVKTTADGLLEQYPYTLTDLRKDAANTSFPAVISDEVAASLGVYPVTPAEPPAMDYTVNLERTAVKQNDVWIEQWSTTPASPAEIAERTDAKAAEVRQERNDLLMACDWTQLPDSPVDKTAWAAYRQQLRDVTDQSGFPWQVDWPTAP